MKFIQDDDYILLMEDSYGGRFTQDDLKRLADSGIRTMLSYPFWINIEPQMGVYSWEETDNTIEKCRKAGIKCLFAAYDKPPKYFPPEWYIHTPEGNVHVGKFKERVISPWNAEGWAYHLAFLEKFCNKVTADDVMCWRAVPRGAEAMFPHDPARPHRQDGPYVETLLKMMLEEQDIFYRHHSSHELWTCLHHAFDHQGTAGTEHSEMLIRAIRDKFPDFIHYCISYSQFRRGVPGKKENLDEMHRLGLSMFAGSEYADGLLRNTDKAIAQGFRGLICGPIMYLTKYRQMQDWMFDNFAWSIKRWREAKGV